MGAGKLALNALLRLDALHMQVDLAKRKEHVHSGVPDVLLWSPWHNTRSIKAPKAYVV